MSDENSKQEKKEDVLGKYGGVAVKLDHDQILSIGGGVTFYEVLDADGWAKPHVAMPALLRDRSKVKDALKKLYTAQYDRTKIYLDTPEIKEDISDSEIQTKQDDIEAKVDKLAMIELDALLEIAFYCFKRSDSMLDGKDIEEGKKIIEGWIDEAQLLKLPKIAQGLNKFETPQMGAVR